MVRGRQGALVGQGRLGLGREVAPSQHPSACGAQRGTTTPLKLLPEWHQINNTWGTNPSPRLEGSPMPRGAWTEEQDEHLDALSPSQGAQRAPGRWHRESIQGQGAAAAPAAAPPAWRGWCSLCLAVPWGFLYMQMCSREWAQMLWAQLDTPLLCLLCWGAGHGQERWEQKGIKEKKMGGADAGHGQE